MSAKSRNLNLLKRCGYQTNYQIQENEIIIICHAESDIPDLEIVLNCRIAPTQGKEGTYHKYIVEKAKIIDLKTKKVSSFESNGEVVLGKDSANLIPGKPMIDVLLPMVDQGGGYKDLWRLSEEILRSGKDEIEEARARELLAGVSSIPIIDDKISHPLIFTGNSESISFISRAMLEYCLAYELNRKEPSNQELRKSINRDTIEFLDFDQAITGVFSPVNELKGEILMLEKYELAARLRDLEVNLLAEYMRKSWPNLSHEEAHVFTIDRLKNL